MWLLQPKIDNTENWAYVENMFTENQCKQIISLGESLLPKEATTFGGYNANIRDSKVSWIYPIEESEWIFRKLTDAVLSLNNQFFKFDIDGFGEGLQFTKYEAPAGKYNLHIDKSFKANIRKLSIVVQLSSPSDYEGGELCLQVEEDPLVLKKEQGYLVSFPSYVLHAVKPVTKGTRYSLVAWITGPSFK